MIESITIENYRGESVDISLGSPEQSGFSIIDIDGLGPPKATINTNKVAGMDGSNFNSVSAENRNIVLRLGFYNIPGEMSIEDARQASYKFLPIKSEVKFTIETTNRTLYTIGYVESNEPDIFSREERSTVSIICPDPYFYDDINEFSESTIGIPVPTFEFPFGDDFSLSPTIEFATDVVGGSQELLVHNPGDKDVGIIIELLFGITTGGLYFQQLIGGAWVNTMYFNNITNWLSGGFVVGDKLYMSTMKGAKYAYVVREGIEYNVLPSLLDYSTTNWITMVPGTNKLRAGASIGFDDGELVVKFKPKYEGV